MIFSKEIFYLLIIPFSLFGCKNDIGGVYVSNTNNNDTIKIYPNHKFIRIYYDLDNKIQHPFIDSGTWEHENGRVQFNNWVDRNGMQHLEGEGKIIFTTNVEQSIFSGKTKLIVDYDMDYYYYKINGANPEKQLK